MTNSFENLKIGFIGGGVMGDAMINGLLKQQTVTADQITVSDPLPERVQYLAQRYRVHATTHNDLPAAADIIILAIKPQMVDKIIHELHGRTNSARLILSILAGVTIAQLAEGLGNPNIVRSMPNTPARIGQGITVWTAANAVGESQRAQTAQILAAMGQEVYVDNEDYLNMATALSGNGPAYVFIFMEAMIDAGVHLGFPRRIAEQLVLQTMRGSVEYAAESKEHVATLRNQVTSPGGTTAEALYHIERGGLRTVMARAIWAAYRRSVSLGAGGKSAKATHNPEENDHDR
jgi:pyrroline-5-carboxylate reductase